MQFMRHDTSRLRKKGISAACSLTLVSPKGREAKESGHSFGFAQDKLLCRVRNVNIFIDCEKLFFPHPAKASLQSVRLNLFTGQQYPGVRPHPYCPRPTQIAPM